MTGVPAGPELTDKVEMDGTRTVKVIALLGAPPTVTTTGPLVAATGTLTTMLVAVQLEGVPTAPLNVTVLVPWAEPKFEPVIVTGVPASPDVTDKLEIVEVISFQ